MEFCLSKQLASDKKAGLRQLENGDLEFRPLITTFMDFSKLKALSGVIKKNERDHLQDMIKALHDWPSEGYTVEVEIDGELKTIHLRKPILASELFSPTVRGLSATAKARKEGRVTELGQEDSSACNFIANNQLLREYIRDNVSEADLQELRTLSEKMNRTLQKKSGGKESFLTQDGDLEGLPKNEKELLKGLINFDKMLPQFFTAGGIDKETVKEYQKAVAKFLLAQLDSMSAQQEHYKFLHDKQVEPALEKKYNTMVALYSLIFRKSPPVDREGRLQQSMELARNVFSTTPDLEKGEESHAADLQMYRQIVCNNLNTADKNGTMSGIALCEQCKSGTERTGAGVGLAVAQGMYEAARGKVFMPAVDERELTPANDELLYFKTLYRRAIADQALAMSVETRGYFGLKWGEGKKRAVEGGPGKDIETGDQLRKGNPVVYKYYFLEEDVAALQKKGFHISAPDVEYLTYDDLRGKGKGQYTGQFTEPTRVGIYGVTDTKTGKVIKRDQKGTEEDRKVVSGLLKEVFKKELQFNQNELDTLGPDLVNNKMGLNFPISALYLDKADEGNGMTRLEVLQRILSSEKSLSWLPKEWDGKLLTFAQRESFKRILTSVSEFIRRIQEPSTNIFPGWLFEQENAVQPSQQGFLEQLLESENVLNQELAEVTPPVERTISNWAATCGYSPETVKGALDGIFDEGHLNLAAIELELQDAEGDKDIFLDDETLADFLHYPGNEGLRKSLEAVRYDAAHAITKPEKVDKKKAKECRYGLILFILQNMQRNPRVIVGEKTVAVQSFAKGVMKASEFLGLAKNSAYSAADYRKAALQINQGFPSEAEHDKSKKVKNHQILLEAQDEHGTNLGAVQMRDKTGTVQRVTTRSGRSDTDERLAELITSSMFEQLETADITKNGFHEISPGKYEFRHDFSSYMDFSRVKAKVAGEDERKFLKAIVGAVSRWQEPTIKVKDKLGNEIEVILKKPMFEVQPLSETAEATTQGQEHADRCNFVANQQRLSYYLAQNQIVDLRVQSSSTALDKKLQQVLGEQGSYIDTKTGLINFDKVPLDRLLKTVGASTKGDGDFFGSKEFQVYQASIAALLLTQLKKAKTQEEINVVTALYSLEFRRALPSEENMQQAIDETTIGLTEGTFDWRPKPEERLHALDLELYRHHLARELGFSRSMQCKSGTDRTGIGFAAAEAIDRFKMETGRSFMPLVSTSDFSKPGVLELWQNGPQYQDLLTFKRFFREALLQHAVSIAIETKGYSGMSWAGLAGEFSKGAGNPVPYKYLYLQEDVDAPNATIKESDIKGLNYSNLQKKGNSQYKGDFTVTATSTFMGKAEKKANWKNLWNSSLFRGKAAIEHMEKVQKTITPAHVQRVNEIEKNIFQRIAPGFPISGDIVSARLELRIPITALPLTTQKDIDSLEKIIADIKKHPETARVTYGLMDDQQLSFLLYSLQTICKIAKKAYADRMILDGNANKLPLTSSPKAAEIARAAYELEEPPENESIEDKADRLLAERYPQQLVAISKMSSEDRRDLEEELNTRIVKEKERQPVAQALVKKLGEFRDEVRDFNQYQMTEEIFLNDIATLKSKEPKSILTDSQEAHMYSRSLGIWNTTYSEANQELLDIANDPQFMRLSAERAGLKEKLLGHPSLEITEKNQNEVSILISKLMAKALYGNETEWEKARDEALKILDKVKASSKIEKMIIKDLVKRSDLYADFMKQVAPFSAVLTSPIYKSIAQQFDGLRQSLKNAKPEDIEKISNQLHDIETVVEQARKLKEIERARFIGDIAAFKTQLAEVKESIEDAGIPLPLPPAPPIVSSATKGQSNEGAPLSSAPSVSVPSVSASLPSRLSASSIRSQLEGINEKISNLEEEVVLNEKSEAEIKTLFEELESISKGINESRATDPEKNLLRATSEECAKQLYEIREQIRTSPPLKGASQIKISADASASNSPQPAAVEIKEPISFAEISAAAVQAPLSSVAEASIKEAQSPAPLEPKEVDLPLPPESPVQKILKKHLSAESQSIFNNLLEFSRGDNVDQIKKTITDSPGLVAELERQLPSMIKEAEGNSELQNKLNAVQTKIKEFRITKIVKQLLSDVEKPGNVTRTLKATNDPIILEAVQKELSAKKVDNVEVFQAIAERYKELGGKEPSFLEKSARSIAQAQTAVVEKRIEADRHVENKAKEAFILDSFKVIQLSISKLEELRKARSIEDKDERKGVLSRLQNEHINNEPVNIEHEEASRYAGAVNKLLEAEKLLESVPLEDKEKEALRIICDEYRGRLAQLANQTGFMELSLAKKKEKNKLIEEGSIPASIEHTQRIAEKLMMQALYTSNPLAKITAYNDLGRVVTQLSSKKAEAQFESVEQSILMNMKNGIRELQQEALHATDPQKKLHAYKQIADILNFLDSCKEVNQEKVAQIEKTAFDALTERVVLLNKEAALQDPKIATARYQEICFIHDSIKDRKPINIRRNDQETFLINTAAYSLEIEDLSKHKTADAGLNPLCIAGTVSARYEIAQRSERFLSNLANMKEEIEKLKRPEDVVALSIVAYKELSLTMKAFRDFNEMPFTTYAEDFRLKEWKPFVEKFLGSYKSLMEVVTSKITDETQKRKNSKTPKDINEHHYLEKAVQDIHNQKVLPPEFYMGFNKEGDLEQARAIAGTKIEVTKPARGMPYTEIRFTHNKVLEKKRIEDFILQEGRALGKELASAHIAHERLDLVARLQAVEQAQNTIKTLQAVLTESNQQDMPEKEKVSSLLTNLIEKATQELTYLHPSHLLSALSIEDAVRVLRASKNPDALISQINTPDRIAELQQALRKLFAEIPESKTEEKEKLSKLQKIVDAVVNPSIPPPAASM
ncbi:MAG: hypothetical protein JWO53_655 [Chlamydiia bacterium]|nr:hypothetical protein [Chlamydiia bacterium]